MKLLKYCKIDQYTIQNLIQKELYFSSVLSFDDPADSAIVVVSKGEEIAEIRECLSDYLKSREYPFQEDLLSLLYDDHKIPRVLEKIYLQDIGVCCFSGSLLNPVMFSQYGDQHRGICLEFNANEHNYFDVKYDEMKEHVDINNAHSLLEPLFKIATSLYSEICEEGSDGGILTLMHTGRPLITQESMTPLLKKQKAWEYQGEFRIFADEGPNRSKLYEHLGLSLEKIIFGQRVPDTQISFIRNLEALKGIDFFIYEMGYEEGGAYWKERGI